MLTATISEYHGSPAIMVNGSPYPPMTITAPLNNPSYLKQLGEAGFRIFYVNSTTRWNKPGKRKHTANNPYAYVKDNDDSSLDGIAQTLVDLETLMKAVPDAYVMLRLNIAPPAEWVNAHPEEQVTFQDGSHKKTVCSTVSKEAIDGMHSLCSKAWKRDAAVALTEYFDVLEQSPYFDRVIGFFLCAGGTCEWYYPQNLMPGDGRYGDFSKPFMEEYSRFLKEKYGTQDALRRSWNQPDATFQNPIIPTIEDRTVIYDAEKKIKQTLSCWESAAYKVGGMDLDINGRTEANIGVFLNVNTRPYVADFYDAWHEGTARTIVDFATFFKTRYPQRLVGSFYGSLGCTSYFNASTACGTLTILDSGVVDFLASPGVYNNREPGGIVAQRQMQDSFRLRNRIFICEDDSRTHLCKPWMQRDAMALYTLEDSLNTLKRDFARDLCEDVHGWWFDMSGDWYNEPSILALFRRQQDIAAYAYSLDRRKHNDIALIYDTESLHLVSESTSQLVTDYYRTSDLGRIGAPVDYYYHNDMANPNMPDYKLYVMVNVYCLTDEERLAIHNKARKNHATILWLYAPGLVNPKAKVRLCSENAEKTVGMKLSLVTDTFFPHFRVDPNSHPAVKNASKSRRYGVIDRDVHSNIWIGQSVLPIPFINPGFHITDENATVLGRFCHNGEPAFALKEQDGFVSVFCATQVLRNDLIAGLAQWAGCHLYAHGDDVVYANENFVSLHACDDGKRTVYFKKKCSPYEVYEQKFYGYDVDHIEVDMMLGETKMWCLDGTV